MGSTFVAFVAFCLSPLRLPVCSGQNHPPDAIHQPTAAIFRKSSSRIRHPSWMLSIKPGPLQAVNLYGRANGNVAQFISFLEKWVRASGVHQGNEENEEFCPAPAS
jgi:hypothetical protein